MTAPGPRSRQQRAEWVATPPSGVRPPRRRRTPARYSGPPFYPAPPRWGFPQLSWRWPLALPSPTERSRTERLRSLGGTAIAALWATAVAAGVGALAELWRYLLLMYSRTGALDRTVLVFSDALVTTAGLLLWVVGLPSAVVTVLWGLRARAEASRQAHLRPARTDGQVILGVLVPGLNLVRPGSVLAELEHVVHTLDPAQGFAETGARRRGRSVLGRPRPSRLVLAWWVSWGASLVLGWTALLWSLRTTVQALADGVALHAWNDVAVAVLAVLTAIVVRDLTTLLIPVHTDEVRRYRVHAVHGASTPPRPERPTTAPR